MGKEKGPPAFSVASDVAGRGAPLGSGSSTGQLGGLSARALSEIQKRSVAGDGARAQVYRSFVPPAQAAVCGSVVTLLFGLAAAGPADLAVGVASSCVTCPCLLVHAV